MGAWSFIEPNLAWVLDRIEAQYRRPVYAGRPASAATATGLMSKHQHEQKTLVSEALTGGAGA
jgi:2-oxoglutarate dehydrogenase E1 component